MKIERTKNTVRNIKHGVFRRIINTILPFFSRTVIIYVLGIEYLGLSSLFTSILGFLSLAELGFGGAITYSMYRPIADNDADKICALLNLYRRIYTIIGTAILVIGLAIMPFLPYIIKGDVPGDINIYILYAIYLSGAVLSYFVFAYKFSLLAAHQRDDINSKVGSIISIISYAVQLSLLYLTKSYYAYIIWLPIFIIITNIIRFIIVRRMYPTYIARGEIAKEERRAISKKVVALFGTKLNSIVLNSADNIVISMFLGIKVVAVYGNYLYIMTAITGFLGILYVSMLAGVGNSIVTESADKNYNDYCKFSFINSWIVGWCSICLLCLYQPFMTLWVGDELTLSIPVMIALVVYFYVYQSRKITLMYKDAAGLWWEDRFRPYVVMSVNIVSNLILVTQIGLLGVVLSTILSFLIAVPWELYTVFKYVFKRKAKEFYGKYVYYTVSTVLIGALTYLITRQIQGGFLGLLYVGIICATLPNLIYVVMFHKREEFKVTWEMIQDIIKRPRQ